MFVRRRIVHVAMFGERQRKWQERGELLFFSLVFLGVVAGLSANDEQFTGSGSAV